MNRAAGGAAGRAVSHVAVFAPAGAFAAIAFAIIRTSFAPYGPKQCGSFFP